MDAIPAAGFAFVLAIVGALLYYWRHKLQSVAGVACGLIGAVTVMLVKSGMANELAKEQVVVQTEIGYTLSVMLFFGMALWNAYVGFRAPDAPLKGAALSPRVPDPPVGQ